VAVVGVGIAVYFNQRPTPAPPDAFAFGAVTDCRIVPAFARTLGFDEASVMDTQGQQKGLAIYSPPANASDPPTDVYQDPTWDDAGYLGPLTTDHHGNIYVAPAPRVSLLDNPPARANTLFKVDAVSGKLAPFLDLPAVSPPSPQNSFGIMGLAYDCDTHNLYVSSVAGSTPSKELGKIFRIDVDSGKVLSSFDNVDAFGLGIYNGVSGKRLYFGSARTSDVRSVALAVNGDFAGIARPEFSLAGLGDNGDDKARRLLFSSNNSLIARGYPFEFNLIATSGRKQTDYQYRYNTGADAWQLAAGAGQ